MQRDIGIDAVKQTPKRSTEVILSLLSSPFTNRFAYEISDTKLHTLDPNRVLSDLTTGRTDKWIATHCHRDLALARSIRRKLAEGPRLFSNWNT
jgi:hypothetical protein